MERIPTAHKIVIEYSDLSTGSLNLTMGSQLLSEIEGRLILYLDQKSIFNEENILLLELAIALNRWMGEGEHIFNYDSIDYDEDESILSFKEGETGWTISGTWMDKSYSGIELSDLVCASCHFIKKLVNDLDDRSIDCRELFHFPITMDV